jgi:hypothetical protein
MCAFEHHNSLSIGYVALLVELALRLSQSVMNG